MTAIDFPNIAGAKAPIAPVLNTPLRLLTVLLAIPFSKLSWSRHISRKNKLTFSKENLIDWWGKARPNLEFTAINTKISNKFLWSTIMVYQKQQKRRTDFSLNLSHDIWIIQYMVYLVKIEHVRTCICYLKWPIFA